MSPNDASLHAAIMRLVCAELSQEIGFNAVHETALLTLSDVCTRYISEVSARAGSYANLARRTQTNAWDVLAAVGDLGATASDLLSFKRASNELPFVYGRPGRRRL
jgi:histone H3/H4